MKTLTKRINPFGPLTGAWRGPNTDQRFDYLIGSNVFYRWIDSVTVKTLIEDNGHSYESFKAWYRGIAGSPKKSFNGKRFVWYFETEHVWDFAFQHRFGDYPYPRVTADNRIVQQGED